MTTDRFFLFLKFETSTWHFTHTLIKASNQLVHSQTPSTHPTFLIQFFVNSTKTMPGRHYCLRVQEECIDAIVELSIQFPAAPLEHIFRMVAPRFNGIRTQNLRRWYNHYIEWGEAPRETWKKKRAYHLKCRAFKRTSVVTDEVVESLRTIINEAPELYLDEIAEELASRTNIFLPHSTIHRILHEKLQYSLQVCYESAKQRDEMERERYRIALKSMVKDVEQVIVIDETHKDKRSSRRRRAWGRRNSGGIALKRWYVNEVRYTMIAAFNIDGFVECTSNLYLRTNTDSSNEGAAGTVDGDMFIEWVRNFLCPVLGRYRYSEKNSIVIMDNASTHMDEEVKRLIHATGAWLIYSAPYSPDLSPIEYGFNCYKAYMKRHGNEYRRNEYYALHIAALRSVSRDTAIKEFRKCGIPFSDDIVTSEEAEIIFSYYINSIN